MQIIVLGMHRSGTSAVARLINLMGASVGPSDLVGRPAEDNAKGFWERADVRDLNDALLSACGASWDSPAPYDAARIEPVLHDVLRQRIAETVFALDATRPWVLKDPRMCVTFPAWRAALEAPVCVFALRHPHEVAESLYQRNGMPRALALALWEHYVLAALQHARGLPAVWIGFSPLVADPVAATRALHAALEAEGCTGLRLPSEREIAAFVDPELKHHAAAADAPASAAAERYHALLAGDAASRDGRWSVSAASQELLAWHAVQRGEAAGSVARAEQAERALADAMATNLDQQQRSQSGTLQSQLLGAQAAERVLELERTASALHSAVAEAERFGHESARWAQQRDAEVAQLREQAQRLLTDLGAQASDARLWREQHATLQVRCEQADGALAGLRSRHEQAQIELATARQRIAELQGANQRLVAQLADAAADAALARGHARHAELDNARLLQRQQDGDDAAAWMQQQRSGAIALLGSAHGQAAADAQQLARWLDEALTMMRASFGSARWRVGHLAIRAIELLTLRGRPRLARDHIEQIERNFRAWREGRIDHRALAQHLLAQLGDAGLIEAGAAGRRDDALLAGDVAVSAALRGLQVEPKRDPAARDVICFPVIDWHFRVQRPQHVARVLGGRGHRVVYLCTQPETGARENGFEVLESPAPNVWIVRLRITCAQAPNLYQQRLDGDALAAYSDALDVMRDALGIVTPIAIVDLPFWRPLVEALPGAVLIYDCMDHHAGFSTNTDAMLCEEARLLHAADAVVVTSAWLASRLGTERAVALIRNGADVERFAPPLAPAPSRSRQVIGYLGAISDWFDVELVVRAAKALPDADFVLVGDVTHPDVSAAQRLANVRFVGEVPYSDAPMHVHGFDVCIIPFLITDLTLATNPVKAYEYLAAGKPVIATAMPELSGMDGMVGIAADHDTFVALLRRALAESGDAAARERRRAWARDHDWLQRGEAFEGVMLAQLPKASVVVLAWNNLEYTRACLESLELGTDYPDWELVLVDNASSDGTPEFFREYAASRPHVRVVLNDANLGFAAGNNCGIRAASGDIIVLLNNDTYVTPGWLSGLVGHLRRHPELGIVGPVTNNIGNEAKIDVDYGDMRQMRVASRRWTREHPRGLTFCDVVAFFCCAIPRAVIDEVGLLDEEFGQGFFEDDDYCNRIRATGRKVAIADDVFVHHHLSASFNTLRDERKRELFDRNKVIYERKWGRWQPHAYRAGGR